MPPTAGFQTLGRAPDGAIRLAEAALWIAADEYPGLEVGRWLRAVDGLGHAAAQRIREPMDLDEATAALNELLFEEEGFQGNAADYYDPRNSFLNDVLERRLGIPITLSVLYIEVAAQAGVRVRGVGLPGHFLIRAERHGASRLLDPFHGGATLEEADCEALLRRRYGAEARLDPALLRPVTTSEIVARMLANLKAIYTTREDWSRALRVVDRLVTLRPDALAELRDRGTIHARLGGAAAAIRDWERYLEGAADAADADRVRHDLRVLRQALARLN